MNTQYTVAPRRASVNVLNWGEMPFGFVNSKRGYCGIPNRFRVETFSDSVMWIGETKIDGDQIFYRFSLKMDPNFASPWSLTPTTAYLEVVKQIKQSKDSLKGTNLEKDLKKLLAKKSMEGCNGALLIGVTYLQTPIRKRFPYLGRLISEFESNVLKEKQHQQKKIKNEKKRMANISTPENKRGREWYPQPDDNVEHLYQYELEKDKARISFNSQSFGYHSSAIPPSVQKCCCSTIPFQDDDDSLFFQELSQGFPPEESEFSGQISHHMLTKTAADRVETQDMMEGFPLRGQKMQRVKEEGTAGLCNKYDLTNYHDHQKEDIFCTWPTDAQSLEQDIPSFLLDEPIVNEDMMLVDWLFE